MPEIPASEIELCKNLLKLFTIEGQTADQVATAGQIEIFHAIVIRPKNRVQIITPTQYGKSLFIALGCLILTCVQGEMVVVVSPTDSKSRIIMRYFIDHLGDSPLFYSQLEKNTRLDRLRMEESKQRITFRNHGGIFTLSANVSSGVKAVEAAMGEGAKNVIQDESCLIPDVVESTIFRMIAGKSDAFYCKIGNPFYRNHFRVSWRDPKYYKIFIDYHQGISEGRYTQEFIDEAKRKPHFDILFECKFPEETTVDDRGFTRLLTDREVETAQKLVEPFGEQRLGVDVAEGGSNFTVLVTRFANYAKKVLKYHTDDTMDVAAKVASFSKSTEMIDQNIFVDSVGVGKGVYDRLVESNFKVAEVKGSEKADDPIQFANKRAECYWRLRQWVREGGALQPDADWSQLMDIKYKVDIQGRLLIMSKDDMLRFGIQSPDVADALAMTFSRRSILNPKRVEERSLLKEFDANRGRSAGSLGARYKFT